MAKQSSPELSTLAAHMMAETRLLLVTPPETYARAVTEEYLRNVLSLCGSVLSQDETHGR